MFKKISLMGGVLALVAALAIPAAEARAPVQLSAQLKGSEEVPGPGDANGKGEAFVNVKRKKRKVCFQLEWRKIDEPTAGHIHRGADGVAGPVKVTLFEDPTGLPVPGAVEGCVGNLKRKLIRKLAKRPQRFYVNVHNGAFPDGAIRGQLEPAL
jgi:hypothetical protein